MSFIFLVITIIIKPNTFFKPCNMRKYPGAFNKKNCLLNFKLESQKTLNFRSTTLKDIKPSITTLELYSIAKLCSLKTCLEDLPYYNFNEFDLYKTEWNEQYQIITNLLKTNKNEFYYIENTTLNKINCYGYALDHQKSRLYPFSTSLVHLATEFQDFLFCSYYKCFKIVNSHPSILLNFIQTKRPNIQVPALKKLVENQDDFFKEVNEELKTKLTSVDEIVDTCFFSESNQYPESKTLTQLYLNISVIRNYIFVIERDNLLPFVNKFNLKGRQVICQRISLQILFCQTEESAWTVKFYEFFRQKVKNFFLANQKHSKYIVKRNYRMLNPDYVDEDISVRETFQFTPFFDYAHINMKNEVLKLRINDYAIEFNQLNKVIQFKEQPYFIDKVPLLEISLLVKYVNIDKFIRSLNKNSWEKLINVLEIDNLKNFSDIHNERIEAGLSEDFYKLLLNLEVERDFLHGTILTEKNKTKLNTAKILKLEEQYSDLRSNIYYLSKRFWASNSKKLLTDKNQSFLSKIRISLLKKANSFDELNDLLK